MNKPILMLGAGGHAKVLFEILTTQCYDLVGVVSPNIDVVNKSLFNCKYYECDSIVETFSPKEIYLVNAVGSLPNNNIRLKLHEKFSSLGYKFISLVSNNANISQSASIEDGVQIMTGCVIQAGVKIRRGSIINTGAIIDHDCEIGNNNHIAPGATLSGQVITGNNVHIGTGASIIQDITIGENVVIASGAIVTESVDDNNTIFGFRSKAVKRKAP